MTERQKAALRKRTYLRAVSQYPNGSATYVEELRCGDEGDGVNIVRAGRGWTCTFRDDGTSVYVPWEHIEEEGANFGPYFCQVTWRLRDIR